MIKPVMVFYVLCRTASIGGNIPRRLIKMCFVFQPASIIISRTNIDFEKAGS